MGDYIHKCELCGETFDLYKGEGWGESYIKEGAMLPSTRYVCMKCINKRKENKKMIRVFEATAYDKSTNGISFETYLVSGLGETDDTQWISEQLKPYDVLEDEVHYYFAEGELDDRAFIDTDEFFYLIREEITRDDN